MLRWQRKSELKRHKLWTKLIACSFGMHLVILVLLFVGYRDTIKLTFSMGGQSFNKKSAPVTLYTLPTPKVAQRTAMRHAAPRRKIVQKKVIKKPVTKVAAKKIVPVKKTVVKKTAQSKQKPEPKKLAHNKAQQVQQKVTKVSKQIMFKQQQKVAQQAPQKSIQFDTNQNIDLNMQQDFVALQQELAKHWQPPVGIAHECVCAITAQIDRQGKIENIIIDDSSGVLMFDVAARTAMLAMELPRWTWGKSLSITFKP